MGQKEKFWFFHPLDCWKINFPKQGKYFTVNKSTIFAPFCHCYINPLTFTSFLHKPQAMKILNFFPKNQNSSQKPEKSRLYYVNLSKLINFYSSPPPNNQKTTCFQYQLFKNLLRKLTFLVLNSDFAVLTCKITPMTYLQT